MIPHTLRDRNITIGGNSADDDMTRPDLVGENYEEGDMILLYDGQGKSQGLEK
jgi:hypothetical protein